MPFPQTKTAKLKHEIFKQFKKELYVNHKSVNFAIKRDKQIKAIRILRRICERNLLVNLVIKAENSRFFKEFFPKKI